MYLSAAVFLLCTLFNGFVLFWLYFTASDEHKLFYSLFNNAAKEEIFLTEIEKGFDCISDDDKELPSTSMVCISFK